MQLPAPVRILVKTLIRLMLVLLFLGIPAAITWATVFGIGFGLRERVEQALSMGPLETKVRRVSFDLLRGLVAEGVEVFSSKAGGKQILKVGSVAVSPNLSALLSRKLEIDKVVLDDTEAQIPIRNKSGQISTLTIEGVKAHVVFFDNQLHITEFEAIVQGIRLRGGGVLKNPAQLEMEQPGREGQPPPEIVSRLVDAIDDLKFPGSKPTITLEFTADLADLSQLEIQPIALRSGPIVAKDWRLEGIEAEARYVDKGLFLDRLMIRDDLGNLRVWAAFKDKQLAFEADSTLGHAQFFGLLGEDKIPKGLVLKEVVQFSVQGSTDFSQAKPEVTAVGAFQVGGFSFRGVEAESLRANFAWKGDKFFLREARLMVGGKDADADVLVAPGDFRMKATSTIRPTSLAPAMDDIARDLISKMEFQDAPWVQISLRGPSSDFKQMQGQGALKLGRTAMRDVWIDSAESHLEVGGGAITYKNILLTKDKGTGRGTFTYDFGGQQVRLENIVSTLDPVSVLMWIDPKIAEAVVPYKFRQPPTVKGSGVVHMKDLSKNKLLLTVEAQEGLDYELLGKTLNLGKTSANVDIIGAEVQARVKRSTLMGGSVSVSADVSIDPKKPVFDAEVDVRKVDFAKLTKLYFNFDTSKGLVSGRYKFSAPTTAPEKMKGWGTIRIEDGNVFAIPILGPLSDIISKIIPGAGYQTARLATADFEIADETITTKNLEIEGAGFSLFGSGDIFFMRDRMDMSVRINARGLPGIVLFPVSKLFEYVSTDAVSKPEWRPKIIPRLAPSSNSQNPGTR
ncbi:MAG: AsmA-like C-terminal region-containing protein [Terrimicrobiaceae bacterium]